MSIDKIGIGTAAIVNTTCILSFLPFSLRTWRLGRSETQRKRGAGTGLCFSKLSQSHGIEKQSKLLERVPFKVSKSTDQF